MTHTESKNDYFNDTTRVSYFQLGSLESQWSTSSSISTNFHITSVEAVTALNGYSSVLTECSPSKSDTIKKSVISPSSHLHCSIWPVWGSLSCQRDFLTCPRALFLLSFKHCFYFWETFQRLDMINVDCSSRKKIKRQSSNSSQYRGRDA